jgi:hypothetical protein
MCAGTSEAQRWGITTKESTMNLTAHPLAVAAELSWKRESLSGSSLHPHRRHRRLQWPTWRPSCPRRTTGTLRPA